MDQESLLTEIRGVGLEIKKKFASQGIKNVGDLIDNYPRRYDDFSHVESINRIKPGMVTVKAKIANATGKYVRRGLHITEAVAIDESGSVRLTWFNQPYRAGAIKHDAEYFITGEFGLHSQRLSIINPSAELVSDFPLTAGRILPIYRETKGLKSLQIRRVVRSILPNIQNLDESLPDWLIKENDLLSRSKAIEMIHFPDNKMDLDNAKKRLGFEEVFELTLAALLNKYELLNEKALKIPFDERLAKEFVNNLGFKLTDAQRKAVWQIYLDMQKTMPMNRLLEGDVGSGKTVVAAMAALMVLKQGFQVAFMAPTEILARQHAETIHNLLQPLGMESKVSLLVGGLKPFQKRNVHARIKSGQAGFIIGTHALFQEKVDMHQLGLVIVDEQHRFGVEQRKTLQAKAGHMPHVLSMTATPIPRSLALTLYGELDITVIDAKPHGRKPIFTKICSPNSRKQLYEKIDVQLEEGRQMFVVTPLISESESMPAKSAEEVFKELQSSLLKHRRIALLHGKMKPAEKDETMQDFIKHRYDILVSTTVIEVGVDVPNASVMLIENAERFGLAQIHQLRGRVGRGKHQGFCFLVTGNSNEPSRRLRALEQTNDGFELAELDLEIRGPGAIYGRAQHGQLDLRVAKLTDTKLIAKARKSAQEFIDKGENLLKYEHLYERVKKLRAVTNLN